ncbi:MAG: LysR family transcriptional regulator [Pikeienuella sp.]
MDIRTLYTLLAIADHGSFAGAARALGLSISGVSLQMRGLEEETGLTLFDRSRRPPALTPDGRGVVDRARDVIAAWERLSDSLRRPEDAGLLRVGCVHTLVAGILPRALVALRKGRPDLTVHLTTALTHELETAVRHGRIDVAVCTEPESVGTDLLFRQFCTQRLVLIAPESATGDDAAALLAANPYVRFNREARVAALVETSMAQIGVNPVTCMEIDTLEGVLSMVLHGLGVSVVPEPFRDRPLPAGLRMLTLGEPPAKRAIGTLVRPDSVRLRFIDALHAALIGACDADGGTVLSS